MAAIAAIGIVLSLPLIVYGFPQSSADGIYHATYYSNFAAQLWSGELYPRWMYKMNAGLGSPIFYYYPPLAFYLTSVLKPFFPGDLHGWHQLGVSAAIALIASGMFMYLWLKTITDRKSALLGAIIYMIVPYHIAEDLYGRGAFAEVWAFVWMPLILFFVRGVHLKLRFHGLGLAASCALLILTHLLMTMIFLPVVLAYACYLGYSTRTFRSPLMTGGAICMAFGVCSFYWLTALSAQKYVSFEEFRTGYFHYGNWLLGKDLYLGGSLRYFWMLLEVGALLGSTLYAATSRLRSPERSEFLFWSAIILSGGFLMTSPSAFIWRMVPPLQMVQFPWRFNAVLAVAICPILAFAFPILKRCNRPSDVGILVIAALICLLWAQGVAKKAYASLQSPRNGHMQEVRDRMLALGQDANALRPIYVASLDADDLEALARKVGEPTHDTVSQVRLTVLSWKPRDIVLAVDAGADDVVTIPQFYFPGWTAYLADGPRTLPVRPSRPDGLVTIALPAGHHRIRLCLNKNRAEKEAQWVSLASVLVAMIIALISFGRRAHHRK